MMAGGGMSLSAPNTPHTLPQTGAVNPLLLQRLSQLEAMHLAHQQQQQGLNSVITLNGGEQVGATATTPAMNSDKKELGCYFEGDNSNKKKTSNSNNTMKRKKSKSGVNKKLSKNSNPEEEVTTPVYAQNSVICSSVQSTSSSLAAGMTAMNIPPLYSSPIINSNHHQQLAAMQQLAAAQAMPYDILNLQTSQNNESLTGSSSSPLLTKPSESTKRLMQALTERIKLSQNPDGNEQSNGASQSIAPPVSYNDINDLLKFTIHNEPNVIPPSVKSDINGGVDIRGGKSNYEPLNVCTTTTTSESGINSCKTTESEAGCSYVSSSFDGSDILMDIEQNGGSSSSTMLKDHFATPQEYDMHKSNNKSHEDISASYASNVHGISNASSSKNDANDVTNNSSGTVISNTCNQSSAAGQQSSKVLVIKPQGGPSTPPPNPQPHFGYPLELKSPDSGFNESCVTEASDMSYYVSVTNSYIQNIFNLKKELIILA